MSVKLYILVNDYRALLDFIYKGRNWKVVQQSKYNPHVEYRQIVRALILEKRKPYLKELCRAEAKALAKNAPDHSTIIYSRDNVKDVLSAHYKPLISRLNQFYEELIAEEQQIESRGAGPFKMDYIDGATQIHLHFKYEPSEQFVAGLKELIETENKSSAHG